MTDYAQLFRSSLDQLKQEGRYRYFLEQHRSAQHFPAFRYSDAAGDTHTAINWCSNDYLGMSSHEDVISRLSFVAHRSGAGSGGTRNIAGTSTHHRALEKILADWHGKESALLFNGAYQANMTSLQTLGRNIPGLVFFSDERNHASIIEGIRGCRNEKNIFRHNDMAHLEALLQSVPAGQPRLIVFESVYSMSGTLAPVREILRLAKKYNALTYVDEVHAVGLYGKSGSGMLGQLGLEEEIDIINGTLSKAIGVFGGYICASALLIDFIRSHGSGFIFTTSLPPAICAAAAKSINIIQQEEQIRSHFFSNVRLLRQQLDQAAIPYQGGDSHITIIPVREAKQCRELANQLLKQHGIYIQPINYPTVPVGEECLRVICSARHQPKHIHHLVYCLKKLLHGNHPANREKFPLIATAN